MGPPIPMATGSLLAGVGVGMAMGPVTSAASWARSHGGMTTNTFRRLKDNYTIEGCEVPRRGSRWLSAPLQASGDE